MKAIASFACILLAALVEGRSIYTQLRPPQKTWNVPSLWILRANPESRSRFGSELNSYNNRVLRLDYELGGGHGYIKIAYPLHPPLLPDVPLAFRLRAVGSGRLEIKLVDNDGSTFGTAFPLTAEHASWTDIVL